MAFELNFGCPHGMSERGMGAAVGQVPEYIQMATEWCKKYARMPVIVKLTPNVTNILPPARPPRRRRGCRVADQHGQLDHARELRHAHDVSVDRRAWARTAATAVRPSSRLHCTWLPKSRETPGDRLIMYRSRESAASRLARRRRFPGAGRQQRAGLHGRDGLRLQDHRRPD